VIESDEGLVCTGEPSLNDFALQFLQLTRSGRSPFHPQIPNRRLNDAPRRKMNTDKWNTRISVIANIGVVIGLFLLILEIRQNTEMMRAQMHNDSMSIRVQRRFDYANSWEIAGIYGKLTAGMGEAFLEPTAEAIALLSEEEPYRFRSDTIGMRDHLADLFYQCRRGYLDDEFCDYRLRNQIAAMLKI
jgi:hypothetical protein